MKQVIIARKDLKMSPGKLAAQVSHASMAFLTNIIRDNSKKVGLNIYPCKDSNGNVQSYLHPNLNELSEKAYAEGRDLFCAERIDKDNICSPLVEVPEAKYIYKLKGSIDAELMDDWILGVFTKVICEAKNKNQLMKVVAIAEELGLKEDQDFFLIKDACLTELEPEEVDENGVGRTLTCIGFKPLPDDIAKQISKKYQLYK